jgi:hypothetical protein
MRELGIVKVSATEKQLWQLCVCEVHRPVPVYELGKLCSAGELAEEELGVAQHDWVSMYRISQHCRAHKNPKDAA